MAVLLAYCTFNLANVLYLRSSAWFVGLWLLSIGALFVFQRLVMAGREGLSISRPELGGYLLVFLITMVVLSQPLLINSNRDLDGVDTLGNIKTIWMVSVLWLFAGGAASMFTWRESSAVALAIGIILVMAFLQGLGLDGTVAYKDIRYDSDLSNISHLTLEKYVVILLAFAYSISHRTRWLVAFCGMLVLFTMGGRTALTVFALTVLFLNLRGRVGRNILVMGLTGALVIFIGRHAIETGFIDIESKPVRDMLFLDGLEGDNSFNGRRELLLGGLKDLEQQFWVGNFPLTVERNGYFSTYVHNILSAWQFYGFFVFLAIISALLYCLRRMVVAMRRKATPATVFGAFMLIYVVISVVLAKSVMWNLLWFAIGYWLLKPLAPATHSVRSPRRRSGRRRRARSASGTSDPLSA